MRVYVLRNKINGKRYVGQTSLTAQRRFRRHVTDARKTNMILSRAILKYGDQSFEIEQDIETDDADALEIKLIEELKTLSPKGYNILAGGRGKSLLDRQRQSERMKRHFADPANRKHISECRRAFYTNPKNRVATSRTTKKQMSDPVMRNRVAKGVSDYWKRLSPEQQNTKTAALLDRVKKSKAEKYAGQSVEIKFPDGKTVSVPRADFWDYSKGLGLNPTTCLQYIKEKRPVYKGFTFTLRFDGPGNSNAEYTTSPIHQGRTV